MIYSLYKPRFNPLVHFLIEIAYGIIGHRYQVKKGKGTVWLSVGNEYFHQKRNWILGNERIYPHTNGSIRRSHPPGSVASAHPMCIVRKRQAGNAGIIAEQISMLAGFEIPDLERFII